MAAIHPVYYAFAEYLRISEASTVKLEYLDGRIYAMAGGTPEHRSPAPRSVWRSRVCRASST
jgi:hypothetical protein